MWMLIEATSVLSLLIVSPMLRSQAKVNPLVGVWTLNVAQSRYDPGAPARRVTLTYQKTAKGYEWFSDGVDAKGGPTHSEGVIVFDGKYRGATGNQNWDELAFNPLDAFNSE